jgi:hypothetical protein
MKKVIFIALMLMMAFQAAGMGIAPARKVINFEPGVKELDFQIVPDHETDASVEVSGPLAQYITLEKKEIRMADPVVRYSIKLPSELPPGDNLAEFLVMPQSSGEGEISAVIGLKHKLVVRVPYPDEYLAAELFITPTDSNGALFTVSLSNLGEVDLVASAVIEVYDGENKVATINPDPVSIKTLEESKIAGEWQAPRKGEYFARVTVRYTDKEINLEKPFMIGSLTIDIISIETNSFKLGTIAKLDAILQNRWNKRLEEVITTFSISDSDNYYGLDPVSVNLPIDGYGTAVFYWDTKGVDVGVYNLSAIVTYKEKEIFRKIYQLTINENEIFIGDRGQITGRVVGGTKTSKYGGIFGIFLLTFIALLIIVQVIQSLRKNRSPDSRLESYVRMKLKQGHSKDTLRTELIKVGWDERKVDEILKRIKH